MELMGNLASKVKELEHKSKEEFEEAKRTKMVLFEGVAREMDMKKAQDDLLNEVEQLKAEISNLKRFLEGEAMIRVIMLL